MKLQLNLSVQGAMRLENYYESRSLDPKRLEEFNSNFHGKPPESTLLLGHRENLGLFPCTESSLIQIVGYLGTP